MELKEFTQQYLENEFSGYPDHCKSIHDSILTNRRLALTTSLQIGKSAYIQAFLLWFASENPESQIIYVSPNQNQLSRSFDYIENRLNCLDNFKYKVIYYPDKVSIYFNNRSEIILTCSPNITNIKDDAICYIDDAAYVDNVVIKYYNDNLKIYDTTIKTKMILASCPNGNRGSFRDLALNSNDWWFKAKYKWDVVKGRDENWKTEMLNYITEEQFKREFECIF